MKVAAYSSTGPNRIPVAASKALPPSPLKGSSPDGPSRPPVDKIRLSNPRVLRAAAEGLYAGISLPLIGSAVAAATSTPLQLATSLVGGVALGGLIGGGVEALGRYRDPLSGWLRGAGIVGTSLALGGLAGPSSVALAVPLTAGASYLTSNRHGAKQVKSGALRTLGWLALAATNVAFPVLMYRAVGGGGPVAVAAALSVLSTMMVVNPDS